MLREGKKVASGGFFREDIEIRVLSDQEDIEWMKRLIAEKPKARGEAGGSTMIGSEEGMWISADFSSSEGLVVDMAVSDDGEEAVLALSRV